MLTITLHRPEMLNDEVEPNEFIPEKTMEIQLEHSLVSLKKWEAKFHKPFLTKEDDKTREESIYYVKCMTITQHVPDDMYEFLSDENMRDIIAYMEDPMTATWFSKEEGKGKINGRQVTAELLYYWMIALNIPSEYQKWHLNQLMTLIKVCDAENQPPKQRSQKDLIAYYAKQNELRRKKFNTKG